MTEYTTWLRVKGTHISFPLLFKRNHFSVENLPKKHQIGESHSPNHGPMGSNGFHLKFPVNCPATQKPCHKQILLMNHSNWREPIRQLSQPTDFPTTQKPQLPGFEVTPIGLFARQRLGRSPENEDCQRVCCVHQKLNGTESQRTPFRRCCDSSYEILRFVRGPWNVDPFWGISWIKWKRHGAFKFWWKTNKHANMKKKEIMVKSFP